MRSIKEVGEWYILYRDGEKRLLFRYNRCSGNSVFDSGCYVYFRNAYDNGSGETFNFKDSGY